MALLALVACASALPQAELEEAAEALEAQEWLRASELLEEALESDPDNHSARFNLAYAYVQLDQSEPAIRHYRQVLEQQPDLVGARSNLAILLVRLERWQEALTHLEALAKNRPDDYGVRYNLGRAYDQLQDFERAAEAYQKAMALQPDDADATMAAGHALAEAGRLEEAEPLYRRAAQLQPGFARMQLDLGQAFEDAGNDEKALALYKEYASRRPEDGEVHERIGLMHLEREEHAEAIEWLTRAVQVRPRARIKEALSEAYFRNGDREKGMSQLRAAADADPANTRTRLRYATLLLNDQKFEEAAQNYHAVTQVDEGVLAAWNGLAMALYKAENFSGALNALDQAQGRGKLPPASLFLRAILQDRLQMYEQALASYQAFLKARAGLPDEEWKSEQRIKTLKKILERRR